MTRWTPHTEQVGWLPYIFLEDDPRTAQEQADDRYAHGGGWLSFSRFTLLDTTEGYVLMYPSDPNINEVSRAPFRDKTLVLFEHAWVGIVDAQGNLEDVARLA